MVRTIIEAWHGLCTNLVVATSYISTRGCFFIATGLDVSFNGATNRGGLSGGFGCDRVLDLTATEAIALFGKGATCTFAADDRLEV